jgi:heme exporter protein B
MRALVVLLKKDLLVEFRTKETLWATIGMAFLFGVVTSLGLNTAFLSPMQVKSVFPVLLVLNFLFAGILTISRSFEYEFKQGALVALISTQISPSLVFFTKFLSNLLVSFLGLAVLYLTNISLMNIQMVPSHPEILIIMSLLVVGFVALSTLLIPFTLSSQLRGIMLPLVLLPLLFPLLFGSLELVYVALDGNSIDLTSPWLSLLIGFDVIYLALGMVLFEQVVTE